MARAASILIALSMTMPIPVVQGLASPGAVPSDGDGCMLRCRDPGRRAGSLDRIAEMSLAELEQRGRRTGASSPTDAPRPDVVPGYDALPLDAKRAAWRSWLLRARLDAAGGASTPMATAAHQPGQANGSGAGAGELVPQGLSGIWSIEAHGTPEQVLPAGGEASFVVTSRGVLRFPGPRSEPQWMIKPGWIRQVETVDANGDEHRDLVVGVYSFTYHQGAPSVVVVDGRTGETLFTGFSGDDWMWSWTLTQVDGSGPPDIVGLTANGTMLASDLTGEILYEEPVPEYPSQGVSALVAFIGLQYAPMDAAGFGDLDGDGIDDAVLTSSYFTYAFGLVLFEYQETVIVHGLSGADGSVLWRRVLETNDFSYVLSVDAGDLDGDGSQDPVLMELNYQSFVAFGYVIHALDGSTGASMIRDDARSTLLPFGTGRTPDALLVAPYFPLDVRDLDGEGASEIVALAYSYDGVNISAVHIVGRVPGDVPGGTSEEVYRETLDLAKYEGVAVSARVGDADADGGIDVLLHALAFDLTPQDRLKSIDQAIRVVHPDGSTAINVSDLLGLYAVDPVSGQAFGWRVRDDAWVALEEGSATDVLLDLRPYAHPEDIHRDIDGDGVPDLLVTRTAGYEWISGRDGSHLRSIDRPLHRYGREVYGEGGDLQVLEYDPFSGDHLLADLRDGEVIWRLTAEDRSGDYLVAAADFDADGVRDTLVRAFYTAGDRPEARVLAMPSAEEIWSGSEADSLDAADLVKDREGAEVLVQDYAEENTLSAHGPGTNDTLWERSLEGRVLAAGSGIVLIGGGTVSIVDGPTGEDLASEEMGEDRDAREGILADVTGDGTPEALLGVREGSGENATYHLQVLDWANNRSMGPHRISDAEREIIELGGFRFVFEDPPDIRRALTDWDGDGTSEVALREKDHPVVRAPGSGAILAVGPEDSSMAVALDLNGDGKAEVGIVHASGRLRLASHDPGVTLPPEDDPVRRVERPSGPQVDDPDFAGPAGGTLPGADVAAAVVALGVALVVVRRRRR